MRLATSLALSGCAVAVLAACTTTEPVAGPSTAPPAGAGAGAGPARPAPAPSAASPSASSVPKPAATAAKPVARRPSWKTVDFEKAAYGDLGRCVRTAELPDTAEISVVRHADLTGDGVTDAVVAAACRTTTASNPVSVFVYDGTDRRAPLTRLVRIGAGQYLTTAEIRTKGRSVTVVSEALGDRTPRCCPDLTITQTYAWRDGEFRRVALDEAPIGRD